jgi:hypothetical protein
LGGGACRIRDSGRVDAGTLERTATGPALPVTILGDPDDPRIPAAREAVSHWNNEFRRLGRQFHLEAAAVRNDSVPDELLRAASGEAPRGGGSATDQLLAKLSGVPGGIVIALSHTDLISFSVPWRAASLGVVGVRRSDIPPLSMPNTVRNVVAHELGHVLGLSHNIDSKTLMCGRPAPCRPAAFASDSVRFFPLTARDEQQIRERWP